MAVSLTEPRTAPATAWRTVWGSWVAGRLLVLLGALFAGPIARSVGQAQSPYAHGLLGWDAAWYDDIAQHGYAGVPVQGYRFFPLVPLMARVLGQHHTGTALLVLSNGAALLLGCLVHRLAREVGLSMAEARRAVWASALLPAGFVLVMGYSEAVFGCLVAGFLIALSRRHWPSLLALGVLAGLARPTGVLLAVPAGVVAIVLLRQRRPGAAAACLGAAAPLVGLTAWLGWVGLTTGDALRPLRLQSNPGLRGGTVVNTGPQLVDAVRRLPYMSAVGWHLLSAVVVLSVLLTARRRLRLEHQCFVLVTLALALTANRLGSLERYVGSAVPVALAAAVITSRARVRWPMAVLSSAALVVYTALAFAGNVTP